MPDDDDDIDRTRVGDPEDGAAKEPFAAADAQSVKRLFSENFRTHRRHYLIALVLMAITAAMTGASAWIMKDIVNSIFIAQRGELLIPIALTVVGIFLLKGLAVYGSSVVMARVGARIVANLKKRIVARILRQGLSFYDRTGAGELTTRLNQHSSAAREVMNTLVTAVARDFLSLLALVGVMVAQDWQLTLGVMLIGPPAIWGTTRIVRYTRRLARTQVAASAAIVQLLNETVRGVRTVKTFTLERDRQTAIDRSINDVERHGIKMARLSAVTSPLMEALGGIGIGAIVAYGGWRVISGSSDPGAFFAFITAFLMAYEPAKRLINLNVQMRKKLVHVQMLYELLDEPIATTDTPGARDIAVQDGRIVFDGVSFGYRDRPALHDVSFEVAPGEFLAIVGPSGAGKSTLFSLLTRFYDMDRGRILIDGVDLKDMTIASLRRATSVVTQDPFLFTGSIRDNIMMGRPDADEAAFLAAAEGAQVDEFALQLPDGYDAPAGEGGTQLSGGQRQRIAIARALLKDAPILLLDEATSALDTRSEAMVQEALERLRIGRTALVIAHRLSTVRNADRIAVLKDGRVIELGTHAELLAKSGEFRDLHDLQFAQPDPVGQTSDTSLSDTAAG